jgi:hypothetical protein
MARLTGRLSLLPRHVGAGEQAKDVAQGTTKLIRYPKVGKLSRGCCALSSHSRSALSHRWRTQYKGFPLDYCADCDFTGDQCTGSLVYCGVGAANQYCRLSGYIAAQ